VYFIWSLPVPISKKYKDIMQHYKILSKYNSCDQIPGNTGKVGIWHIWGTREMQTGFWGRRPEGKKPLVRLGVEERAVLK
jgi:hypothetical protein